MLPVYPVDFKSLVSLTDSASDTVWVLNLDGQKTKENQTLKIQRFCNTMTSENTFVLPCRFVSTLGPGTWNREYPTYEPLIRKETKWL